MKRIISMVLVLVLLFLCAPVHTNAIVPGEDSIGGGENTTALTIDELFSERARLLLDPNTTQEQLDSIDSQLFSLGVEEISAAEVAAKSRNTAQPMIDVSSTPNTRWYSLPRTIEVVWGQQYEAQTIIGQWINDQSPLTKSETVSRYFNGVIPAATTALQIVAENIVTSSIGNYIPYMDTTLTVALTARDLWNLIDEATAPFIVKENVTYTSVVQMGTTMKLVYVKYRGSLDEGNQVLCYVGTNALCNVSILIPIYTTENGIPKMETIHQQFPRDTKSHAYDSAAPFAANNFRLLKSGATEMDYQHRIIYIPITIMGEEYRAIVPFGYF